MKQRNSRKKNRLSRQLVSRSRNSKNKMKEKHNIISNNNNTNSNIVVSSGYDSEKPREETEYEHFYPDLDIKQPLNVYIVKSTNNFDNNNSINESNNNIITEQSETGNEMEIFRKSLKVVGLSNLEKKKIWDTVSPKSELKSFVNQLVNFTRKPTELRQTDPNAQTVATKTKLEIQSTVRKISKPLLKREGEDLDELDEFTIFNKKRKFLPLLLEKLKDQTEINKSASEKSAKSSAGQSSDSSSSENSSRPPSASSTPSSSVDYHSSSSLVSNVRSYQLLAVQESNCVNRNVIAENNNNSYNNNSVLYIQHPYFTPQLIPTPSLDTILEANPNLIYQQSRIITNSFFQQLPKKDFRAISNANVINSYMNKSDFKLNNFENFEEAKGFNTIKNVTEVSKKGDINVTEQTHDSLEDQKNLEALNKNLINKDFQNKITYFGYKFQDSNTELKSTYLRENDYVNPESFEINVFEEFSTLSKLDIKGFSMFRCMYDMDEQDDLILAFLNRRRIRSNQSFVTPEIFEIAMTFLEKEWHFLEKRIPYDSHEEQSSQSKFNKTREFVAAYSSDDGIGMAPENDQPCAVCNDSECDNQNAIVFCDGCNIAVHQECYGVVFIPEGQWLCRRCMDAKRKKVECEFCPSITGAFKQTESGSWAHLLCGLWIPELSLKSSIYMETIDGYEKIPKNRWKLVCYICKQKVGACIQCANKNCFQAFHVTCAKRSGLYLNMNGGVQGVIQDKKNLTAFCDRHLPTDGSHPSNSAEVREKIHQTRAYYTMLNENNCSNENVPKFKTLGDSISYYEHENIISRKKKNDADENIRKNSSVVASVKACRNTNHRVLRWQTSKGTPVAPQLFVDRLVHLFKFLQLDEEKDDVEKLAQVVCKYWSLKREEKFGPLIKTIDNYNVSNVETVTEAIDKIKSNNVYNNDIHKLISISEDIVKRQKLSLEAYTKEIDNIENLHFPVSNLIKPSLSQLLKIDEKNGKLLSNYRPSIVKDGSILFNIDILSLPQIVDKLTNSGYTKCTIDYINDIKLLFNNVKNSREKTEKVDQLKKSLSKEYQSKIYPILNKLKELEYQTFEKSPKGGYVTAFDDLIKK